MPDGNRLAGLWLLIAETMPMMFVGLFALLSAGLPVLRGYGLSVAICFVVVCTPPELYGSKLSRPILLLFTAWCWYLFIKEPAIFVVLGGGLFAPCRPCRVSSL